MQPKSLPVSTLASRLTAAVEADHLKRSANQIGTEAGLSSGYMSLLMRGQRKSLSREKAEPLSEALGVSCDWLLAGKEPRDRRADEVLTKARERLARISEEGGNPRIDDLLLLLETQLNAYIAGGPSSRPDLKRQLLYQVEAFCAWVDQHGPYPNPAELSPRLTDRDSSSEDGGL